MRVFNLVQYRKTNENEIYKRSISVYNKSRNKLQNNKLYDKCTNSPQI